MTGPGRIGLIGGECTGKSALAKGLARRLDGCVVDEVLREFVLERGRPPRRSEQAGIMAAQVAREEATWATCSGVTIADPAALMTAVYSVAYFDDVSLMDQAVAHAHGYDLLVWCDIDLPWLADPGQRDGPEHRARVHELLSAIVAQQLKPAGISLIRASGALERRIATVTRAWQTLPPIPPT
jgi:nicotinamide riboside kinase